METSEALLYKLFCDSILRRVKQRIIEYTGRNWIEVHELLYMKGIFALSKDVQNSSLTPLWAIASKKQFCIMDIELVKAREYLNNQMSGWESAIRNESLERYSIEIENYLFKVVLDSTGVI